MRFCNKEPDHFGRVNLELQLVTFMRGKGCGAAAQRHQERAQQESSGDLTGNLGFNFPNDFE
jgi:hypothetical protein